MNSELIKLAFKFGYEYGMSKQAAVTINDAPVRSFEDRGGLRFKSRWDKATPQQRDLLHSRAYDRISGIQDEAARDRAIAEFQYATGRKFAPVSDGWNDPIVWKKSTEPYPVDRAKGFFGRLFGKKTAPQIAPNAAAQ